MSFCSVFRLAPFAIKWFAVGQCWVKNRVEAAKGTGIYGSLKWAFFRRKGDSLPLRFSSFWQIFEPKQFGTGQREGLAISRFQITRSTDQPIPLTPHPADVTVDVN
jgi:hypothetical protein